MKNTRRTKWILLIATTALTASAVTFDRNFSPAEGMVSAPEQEFRKEICLNGTWQFQPVEVPEKWTPGQGTPPALALPKADRWEPVPVKVPSPWNVNSILNDRLGNGLDNRTFPSYPERWNHVRMGWLKKSVRIPDEWKGQRIYLHLEAVAGDCRIVVNGHEMALHFDVALPGEFDITSAVRFGQDNEILLGVRDHRLHAETGPHGKLTYPTGSFWLMGAVGVWQDVFLLARPPVHVSDVFMQPDLQNDCLKADVELVNNTDQVQQIEIELPVFEWINHADLSKTNMLKAPEPFWSLGKEALRMSPATATLSPGEIKTVTLQAPANGRLKKWELWDRGEPNLYMASVQLHVNGQPADLKTQRFGWRDVKIENGDFLLNGTRVDLSHDFWHFNGISDMSRRYVWGWYTLAKDAGVRYIRPHAMPFPRYFYDMADEMGMLTIAETGVFASHCDLNYNSADLWKRSSEHTKRLVRRNRNNPSVVGWSVANEVWCVLRSRADQPEQEKIYDEIAQLGTLARAMDPTRNWIQSDGDKDLNGRLGLWTIHCAAQHTDVIPPGKFWGVTEGGSAYFGKPAYYKPFVGDRAFRSFNDRLDALGIECYNLLRTLREQQADIYSTVNLVWHGIKPLPVGLSDPSKKQIPLSDGVFFGPYEEGKPGIQPERIAPFAITVNPGYDLSLPLYDPNPLYLAMQAAMHPDGPQPCKWDRVETPPELPAAPVISNPADQVGFAGSSSAAAYGNLKSMGVPFAEDTLENPGFMIVDLSSVDPGELSAVQKKAIGCVSSGGTVLLVGLSPETASAANRILPAKVTCIRDEASSLLPNRGDRRTAGMSYEELYFAESYINKIISRYSISGDFIQNSTVLLRRNNTDWRRWFAPEYSATISIVRSELENRQTPVLAERKQGAGSWLVSTLEMEKIGEEHADLYRKLFSNLGVRLNKKTGLSIPALDGSALINALVLGRFGADSLAAASQTPFIIEESVDPKQDEPAGGLKWTLEGNNGDRFVFPQMKQKGPEENYAVYFSCRVYSPIDLGDLLGAGPDLPQVTLLCYFSDLAAVRLNGVLLAPKRTERVDYRALHVFERVPLKQGWNHIFVKVASDSLNADPGCLAVRLFSNNDAYNKQIKSAVDLPE